MCVTYFSIWVICPWHKLNCPYITCMFVETTTFYIFYLIGLNLACIISCLKCMCVWHIFLTSCFAELSVFDICLISHIPHECLWSIQISFLVSVSITKWRCAWIFFNIFQEIPLNCCHLLSMRRCRGIHHLQW